MAIVIVLIGAVALRPAGRAIPADHAADGAGHDALSRRQRRRVVDTVALPIEQQVNGVEGMLYMQSTSAQRRHLHADRHLRHRHRPEHGPGAGAEPRRRARCRRCRRRSQAQGVTVQKQSTAILQIVALTSPDGTLRQPLSEQLRHHQPAATSWRALPGVGNVTVLGVGKYCMRIWLDPDKLQRAAG